MGIDKIYKTIKPFSSIMCQKQNSKHKYIYLFILYIHLYKFTKKFHSQTTPSSEWRFLTRFADKPARNYDTE